MSEFTEKEIMRLIKDHNWELSEDADRYFLSQKDKHYMQTIRFDLTESAAAKLRKLADEAERLADE